MLANNALTGHGERFVRTGGRGRAHMHMHIPLCIQPAGTVAVPHIIVRQSPVLCTSGCAVVYVTAGADCRCVTSCITCRCAITVTVGCRLLARACRGVGTCGGSSSGGGGGGRVGRRRHGITQNCAQPLLFCRRQPRRQCVRLRGINVALNEVTVGVRPRRACSLRRAVVQRGQPRRH